MSIYDDLEKLKALRDKGAISEEEFQHEKQRILGGNADVQYQTDNSGYIALMHLSQFAGFIICGLGFLLPVILWVSRSKESSEVDMHGKNIMNFMLSMLIYTILLIPLCFLIVGIPLLIVLGILEIIFIIIAAVKAANGEYWKYPLSITFFS
ncbi:DUF4870 domain-containing protein [Dysgonomonas sp. Marseille-P4361]|uniref:DUF4870 domain-containing protein n=1 Tax=Dysgonomonas sp. Marseille-P4361 TaxID=2161820 RepID=UPI000D5528F0|nr:DUF4870 domain-containing protein [Dysgonomonas sp. Marseille-P4361]